MFFGLWNRLIGNSVSLATTPPVPEATVAQVGAATTAAKADHAHPRLTSTQWGVLDSAGEATFMFTQKFDVEPGIAPTYRELANNPPLIHKVKEWVMDGSGKYAGAKLKFYRIQALPSGLLNITVLNSFDVSAGGSLTGIPVSCIAVKQSA